MRQFLPVRLLAATLFCSAVLLSACSTSNPEPRPMPSLTYLKYPQIRLNVAQIQVVDNYTSSGQSPYIESQMADPLPQVAHDWAAKRFAARGQDGTLVITINKASVMTDSLQRTHGLKGLMTIDQAQKLAGLIDVKFTVSNTSFGAAGNASVQAVGSRTVPENASLQQQDAILANLTEALMVELDAGTQRVFSDKLPTLMQQGGVPDAPMAQGTMNQGVMNQSTMNQGNMPQNGMNAGTMNQNTLPQNGY